MWHGIEVIGVYTSRIAARVIEREALRYWPALKLIDDTMRVLHSAIKPNKAVS
jgi:hypothetical protein